MLVDVVILRQGSSEVLKTHNAKLAWREEGEFDRVNLHKWQESVIELKRLAHWEPNGHLSALEVFLCPRDENLMMNHRFLSLLVDAAQDHAWGGSVHVIVDPKWEPLNDLKTFKNHRDSMREWFDVIYQAGATDVIQWAFNQHELNRIWEYPKCLAGLRACAVSSSTRQAVLSPEENWKGLVRKEDRGLRGFLGKFEVHSDISVPPTLSGNLVTIVEESSAAKQQKLVEKALSVSRGKHLVAIGHPFDECDYIANLRHAGAVQVVRYRGWLELLYLFYLLNPGPRQNAVLQSGNVIRSTPRKQPVFMAHQIYDRPSLLVTSSFSPDDENQCIEAAREVGRATYRKPANTDYRLHLAVTCDRLASVAKSLPLQLTAWLHVGHASEAFGMEEATGAVEPAKRWLDSFATHGARGGSLDLAIFSACQTAEVAELFAKAGVGVAIGFEKKVPADACRLFTADIISAALRSKGDIDAILQAFHIGCSELKAHGYKNVGPVAFRCDRK